MGQWLLPVQKLNIFILQKYVFCYSCSHCSWDWCFSLAQYTFRQVLTSYPSFLCPVPDPLSLKLSVIYSTHSLILEHHNFKTILGTVVIMTLISTGSWPCLYCGQVCWDCSGTKCIHCSQDSANTTQWTLCCLLAASEIWRLSDGELNLSCMSVAQCLFMCTSWLFLVIQCHLYSWKQHIFTVIT
jgi:hypothetical protein